MKRKSNLLYTGEENKALSLYKRRKIDTALQLHSDSSDQTKKDVVLAGPPRTSNLKSPIIQLKGEVLACKFSSCGSYFASAGFDKLIRIWEYQSVVNQLELVGHQSAVKELCWSEKNRVLLSAGADKYVFDWDVENGKIRRKHRGHTSRVNCVSSITPGLFVSGSDDRNVRYWDFREKKGVLSISGKFPVFSIAQLNVFSVFVSGIENNIKLFDIRKPTETAMELVGHKNSVTGIEISHDKMRLASNSMDNTVRVWNIRPYAGKRLITGYEGISHGVDKNLLRCSWDKNDRCVTAGSSCTNVIIFDSETGQLKYRLPGHHGTVNENCFHPVEPVVLSASSDCTLYLGELDIYTK